MKKVDIAILMGSDSDFPVLSECMKVLKGYGVAFDAHVMSAHRTPEAVTAYVSGARARGVKVFIAAAGSAAHLAGVVAAHTTLPVIGVPLNSSDLHGLDALLSTVQMPAGIPVATVAVGKAGAVNAALLALQILSLSNKRIAGLLEGHKKSMVRTVKEKDEKLQSLLSSL